METETRDEMKCNVKLTSVRIPLLIDPRSFPEWLKLQKHIIGAMKERKVEDYAIIEIQIATRAGINIVPINDSENRVAALEKENRELKMYVGSLPGNHLEIIEENRALKDELANGLVDPISGVVLPLRISFHISMNQIKELREDLEKARARTLEIVRREFTQICSYCGWEAPPPNGWDELQKHIEECPEHPIAKYKKAIAELKATIMEIGEFGGKALIKMIEEKRELMEGARK